MDNNLLFLSEAKRLYNLGCAVHWLRPNTKIPVKAGWSKGERETWEELEKSYRQGFGLGIRMGEPSKIGAGFLANIDIDVKSKEAVHGQEALRAFKAEFDNLLDIAPVVKTGNGLRVFIQTDRPVDSKKLFSSAEKVKVLLPGTPISKYQQKYLSKEELKLGYRLRPAWEIDFMSTGKQVVVPPSIHPETQTPYKWNRPFVSPNDLPLLNSLRITKDNLNHSGASNADWLRVEFNEKPVDLQALNIDQDIKDQITGDKDVEDRSSALFSVAMSLLRAGLDEDEVLTLLSDRQYALGCVAFEHRQTNNRHAAVHWLRRYCVDKAKALSDAARVFSAEVLPTPLLGSKEAVAAQKTALFVGLSTTDWRAKLDRVQKTGVIKATLKNIILILENDVSDKLFIRNEFTLSEFYGSNAPWNGGEKGKPITDEDCISIKFWLSCRFHVEPAVNLIHEAIAVIATKNNFHPVKDYLTSLPAWDGVLRIDTWLAKNFAAKGSPNYLAQVFRKWLVASVARVFTPGTKFDWMPVFEGEQGTGKSSFGEILFGHDFFSDRLENLADKDSSLGLQGMLCVEFAELDHLRRNELETVKAFITRTTDRVRPPYGRRTLHLERQCVFFGTTNNKNYLIDRTGNRRFNPVEVGALDFEALHRDRDQLWAEALFLFQNELEPSLYLTGDAIEAAEIVRKEKLVEDDASMMAELIKEFIEKTQATPNSETPFPFEKFKLRQLFEFGGPLEQHFEWNRRTVLWAAKAMQEVKERMSTLEVKYWKSRGDSYWSLHW